MNTNYPADKTAIILIDPYNDFISEGGKIWPMVKNVAQKKDTLKNMKKVLDLARELGIRIFFVPHHRWEKGDLSDWKNATPYQMKASEAQVFEKGSWGGEFRDEFKPMKGDIIIKEHWSASGFANTDLDQQLRQHNIEKIVLIGLLANSCLEATGRYGSELGYHVSLVTDATAAYDDDAIKAAHEINGPMYAHAILTTDELLNSMHKEMAGQQSTAYRQFESLSGEM